MVARRAPEPARRRGHRHPAAPATAHPSAAARSPARGDVADDITAALLDLDSSYLAVHGPPGTGKTFTSARVIAALVNDHRWRVGVVAQSHAVVENLFRDVIDAGVDPARIGQEGLNPVDAALAARSTKNEYAGFIADHDGCVVGGTAWDFANDNRVSAASLDLLVIEEAGQYSLANTIAVARAARNLMLLGDPQQLPQVSQGTHPEPVDESALGWLVDGHHTLPAELRLLPRPLVPDAPRGVRAGVAAVLRRPAALRRRRHRRASARRQSRPACGC